MDVSIIVPVYNCAAFLPRCLESIESQMISDFEVICVDDGSTDESPTILAEAAARWSNIKVITQENSGVSHARNVGLDEAQGDYVLFVDGDDFIDPPLLVGNLDLAHEHDAQMVIFGFYDYFTDFDLDVAREVCQEEELYGTAFCLDDMKTVASQMVTPNVWRILFERDFIEANDLRFPEDLATSEDLAFIYMAFALAKRIVLFKPWFYHYRQDSQSSLTHSHRGLDAFCSLELIRDFAKSHDVFTANYERHFVNLVADVVEYALCSASSRDEFDDLYKVYRGEWMNYVMEHRDVLVPRYERFIENMETTQDAEGYLWEHYITERAKATQFRNEFYNRCREFDMFLEDTYKGLREEMDRCQEDLANQEREINDLTNELNTLRERFDRLFTERVKRKLRRH